MKDPGDLSKSRKDGGKNTGESSKDEDIRYLDIGTIHTEPKTSESHSKLLSLQHLPNEFDVAE